MEYYVPISMNILLGARQKRPSRVPPLLSEATLAWHRYNGVDFEVVDQRYFYSITNKSLMC